MLTKLQRNEKSVITPPLISMKKYKSDKKEILAKLETRNKKLEMRNKRLETRNTKLETRNTKVETRNKKSASKVVVSLFKRRSHTRLG